MDDTSANDKAKILTQLRQEFDSWEELLASLNEEQITARSLPDNLSIKDVIAHLWAWQQLSIARMEAARSGTDPQFTMWTIEAGPEPRNEVDRINAWILDTYGDKPWSGIYRDWRDGFVRFLDLGADAPEADLFDPDRFAWLNGYPLFRVLEGSYQHHREHRCDHLEPMLDTHVRS